MSGFGINLPDLVNVPPQLAAEQWIADRPFDVHDVQLD